MTYFQAQSDYIAAVTRMLNEGPSTTEKTGFYIHVELRESGSQQKVGEWSDEIDDSDWYYQETQDAGKA